MIPGAANPLLLASAQASAAYNIERSVRFNAPDSAYLSRTPSVAGNRKTWTWAGWVKRSSLADQWFYIFDSVTTNPSSGENYLRFNATIDGLHTFQFAQTIPALHEIRTTQVFRDTSAWLHLVLAYDTTQVTSSDRIRLYINGAQVTAFSTATYPNQNDQGAINNNTFHSIGRTSAYGRYFDGYLADIHFIDGQALDPTSFGYTDTNGVWQPIAYTGTYPGNSFHLPFSDNSTAAALGTDTSGNGNTWTVNNLSVYSNDYLLGLSVTGSGWNSSYPAAQAFDSSTTTAAVSNSLGPVTATFAPSTPIPITTSFRALIGNNSDTTQESISIDGVTVASSGQGNTGVWTSAPGFVGKTISTTTPLTYTNTNTGQGLWLYAIEVDGTILVNAPGSNVDSLVDTPTSYGDNDGLGGSVRGNYATWNSLDASATLANGNLETSAPAEYRHARCTIAMPPGKWYAEFITGTMLSGTATPRFGIVDNTRPLTDSDWQSGGYGMDLFTSQNTSFAGKFSASANVTVLVTQVVTLFNTGDVVGVAYDADTGKIWFSRNGTWLYSGNPASGTTPVAQLDTTRTLFFHVEDYSSSSIANFGQRPFAYPAPSGFKALCTTNLPEPQAITTSGSYTGNGVADGPFVYLNGVPTAMTVNGTAVTFGTHADKLSNGFKLRTTSTTYNQNAATYNYSVTSTGPTFKTARAQSN